MASPTDLASYTESAVVTDQDPDAGERCAGWYRRATFEPCRRCGGSGHEPANCGGEMVAALIVLLAWGAGWCAIGAWLR